MCLLIFVITGLASEEHTRKIHPLSNNHQEIIGCLLALLGLCIFYHGFVTSGFLTLPCTLINLVKPLISPTICHKNVATVFVQYFLIHSATFFVAALVRQRGGLSETNTMLSDKGWQVPTSLMVMWWIWLALDSGQTCSPAHALLTLVRCCSEVDFANRGWQICETNN